MAEDAPVAGCGPIGAGELRGLLSRGSSGDAAAHEAAVVALRQDPRLLDRLARAVRSMEETWLSGAGVEGVTRLLLSRSGELVREELLDGESTALERLLVERIVVCGLQLWLAEAACASAIGSGKPAEQVEFRDRMVDRANRRYLAAVKALAQVRRLEVGMVIGRVSVAGDGEVKPFAVR